MIELLLVVNIKFLMPISNAFSRTVIIYSRLTYMGRFRMLSARLARFRPEAACTVDLIIYACYITPLSGINISLRCLVVPRWPHLSPFTPIPSLLLTLYR